ncbi:MAG: hypothetical protein Q9160_007809 [Pyrenula sp. 1 TL-2023]
MSHPIPIPYQPLGKDGPLVPTLGFGAMGLSAFYSDKLPDPERLKVLDRAYELGARHWDTSNFYGDNELLIGKWLQLNPEKRGSIFLATKFGGMTKEDGSPATNADGAMVIRSDADWVAKSCDAALRRLGVNSIDLFYVHRVDKTTPIEKTIRAMAELKRQGKIHHLGVSELSSRSLRRAQATHPISAIQMEYSPFDLSIESPTTNLLSTARTLGIALVAYSPLGRGFITGQYRSPDDFDEGDWRRNFPRFSRENFPKNLELVRGFEEVARRKACTAGQLCLAWLMKQGPDVFLIPGRIKYLEENTSAALVELTDEENAEIRRLVEAAEVHGERVPAGFADTLYADTPPADE